MDFDPTLLRAFVAVQETGGFTRAAQRLNLTQSAISHQIRRLEEQVGRQLLHRTTRKLTLTEDGEEFLRHAGQILTALDSLTRRFQPSPVSGVVRFGVLENFMGDRLAPLLGRFTRAFPTVRLEVYVDVCLDLRGKIAEGELDLAVVTTLAAPPEETVLRPAQFVWVAAETFDPPRGAPLPLAFSPAPCAMRDLAITALSGTAVDWHVLFTSPSQRGLCAAVQAGLAISVLTRNELEPGMKVVDGQYGLPPLPKADFSLLWSAGDKTAAAREFGRMILAMPEPLAAPAPRLVVSV